MDTPKRIQRRRTRGWRKPEGAVSVTRPGPWGNPLKVGDPDPATGRPMTAEDAVERYRGLVLFWLVSAPSLLDELRGKDLMCYCPLDSPCHADVLLELANRERA